MNHDHLSKSLGWNHQLAKVPFFPGSLINPPPGLPGYPPSTPLAAPAWQPTRAALASEKPPKPQPREVPASVRPGGKVEELSWWWFWGRGEVPKGERNPKKPLNVLGCWGKERWNLQVWFRWKPFFWDLKAYVRGQAWYYSFSRNHGSGKWLYLWKETTIGDIPFLSIFHFDDYGRKGERRAVFHHWRVDAPKKSESVQNVEIATKEKNREVSKVCVCVFVGGGGSVAWCCNHVDWNMPTYEI